MNMFKPSKAKNIEEYLASVPEERQEAMNFLHKYIQKAVPTLKAYFANNMIGYGKFAYLNYKKETIDWPIIALANQKQYISIYICALVDGKYLAETYQKELGKVSVGKSCIRLKKLENLNLDEFEKVLRIAAENPGLTQ